MAASAVTAIIPITGVLFLPADEYATWALLATLTTISLLFDFGAPTAATTLAATRHFSGSAFRRLSTATAAPPLILGALAVAAWPWYATQIAASPVSTAAAQLTIVTLSLGAVLRSVSAVLIGAALGYRCFRVRAIALMLGAGTNAIATLTLLYVGTGVFSLGAGTLLAGVVQLAVTLVGLRRRDDVGDETDTGVRQLVNRFISSRGIGSIAGLFVTQFDRWALALVAPASVVGAYDLSARLASLPKVALIAFSAGLAAEAAGRDGEGRRRLLSGARKATSLVAGAGLIVVVPSFWILQHQSYPGSETLAIGLVVIVAHTVNSCTTPSSVILAGIGRPQLELRYLLPLAALALVSYGLGLALDSYWTSVAGWAVAMISTSMFFVLRSPAYLEVRNEEVDSRAHDAARSG